MKRDFDLAREILRQIEESSDAVGVKWIDLEIEGRDPVEVSYHVRLLDEAGLIEAFDLTTMGGFDWRPKRLTWAGHEFLDAARDDARWEKAKDLTVKTAGSLSFEGLKYVLTQLLRATLGA
ncbi:MAG: DUF2513 domain-containing protein [Gammaproteobacteria bacterium]